MVSIFIAVILIIVALIYAINNRQEPMRTAYAGTALLVSAVLLFIAFFIIMQIGIRAIEAAALAFLQSAVALIPAGTIVALAGLILHYRQSK